MTDSGPGGPLISVVTIVKNDRPGLIATVDSVRAQRFTDFEHVIVDGASTDGSADLVRARAAAGELACFVSEPDAGISDAFNKGLSLARGQWLNFLNAGDALLDPGVLERVAARMPGADIVTGYSVTAGVRSPPYPVGNQERLPRRAWISHQASFIHRRVFDACGGFDPRFRVRMDYEFWLRALPRFSYVFMDEPLVDFAPGGASTRLRREFFDEEFAANRMHLPFAFIANLRVRARERLHEALRSTGLFDRYRALRLRP
jgi:glycosyltransferase involved in cell wall biosynthesis